MFGHILGGISPEIKPWKIGLIYGRYLQWIGSWNGHWMMKPFTSFATQQLPDFRVPALFSRSSSGTRGLGSGNDTFSYPTVTAVGNHPLKNTKSLRVTAASSHDLHDCLSIWISGTNSNGSGRVIKRLRGTAMFDHLLEPHVWFDN